MKAEIKGSKLIIELDLTPATPSSSGKMLMVASTGGFFTSTAQVDGKPVKVSVNAGIGR